MRRAITTLALIAAMVLGGASVALAHPNEPAAIPSPFGADNAVAKKGLEKSGNKTVLVEGVGFVNPGIAKGYFVHSPTCILHPLLGHE